MITYYAGQCREIADIFHGAVHRVASARYTAEQVEAWAPTPVDHAYWKLRCELKRPFVSLDAGRLTGFLEFDPDGHIDCHYVHPDRNRRGIGAALLRHVLDLADALALPRVYVEASHIARGLYLRHGFRVESANLVTRRGVTFENWKMERLRSGSTPATTDRA